MQAPKPIGPACSGLQAPRHNDGVLTVRTIARDHAIEIWLYRGERPVHRQASLSKALVADAERYGQHLLENARNDALRCIEQGVRARAIPV